MSEELISKKDLLLETGISYGQLYRWKRKDLIPEEWFIRKSAYTGQETFFPKLQILERISKIQELKDTMSLDELAAFFSPAAQTHSFEREGSAISSLVTPLVLDLYLQETGYEEGTLYFDQAVGLYLLEKMLQTGDVSLEEAKMVVHCLKQAGTDLAAKNLMLVLVRKLGVSTVLLVAATDELYVDSQSKIIAKIQLGDVARELKEKLI